jgi:hypothetical protein
VKSRERRRARNGGSKGEQEEKKEHGETVGGKRWRAGTERERRVGRGTEEGRDEDQKSEYTVSCWFTE